LLCNPKIPIFSSSGFVILLLEPLEPIVLSKLELVDVESSNLILY